MKKNLCVIGQFFRLVILGISKFLQEYKKPLSIIITIFFIITGFILNMVCLFPHFYIMMPLMIIIGVSAFVAEHRFKRIMDGICADSASQPPFFSAKIGYDKQMRGAINWLIPICVVIFYIIGLCILFQSLEISVTFVWCALVFFFVVYISIQGYLQYFYLCLFIRRVALSNKNFVNLPVLASAILPKEIDWRQKLKSLTMFYQVVFFGLGSLYISGFALFCYLPDFLVSTNEITFYVLWAVTFIAIVVVFPVVAVLESNWQKRITLNLKNSYSVLWRNEVQVVENNSNMSPLLNEFLREKCLSFAFSSTKRGTKHYLGILYSLASAVFNFFISMITLIQFYGAGNVSS